MRARRMSYSEAQDRREICDEGCLAVSDLEKGAHSMIWC